MCDIVLIGGGGHCRSVIDSIERSKSYDTIVITDQNEPIGSSVCGYKVVGNDDFLPSLLDEGFIDAFISVGSIKNTSVRRNAQEKAYNIGFSFPSIVDPSAIIAGNVTIGSGVYVGKKTVVNSNSTISDFAIINTGAIIEHDCRIGEFAHISVGAVVCGGCNIGNDVFVGANSTVIQEVKIGDNSIIGAGSIILADVPKNAVIVGTWGGVT